MLDNAPRGTICIEDIEIGMTRSLRKVITDRDIEMFSEVSTDRNPVHLDEDYLWRAHRAWDADRRFGERSDW